MEKSSPQSLKVFFSPLVGIFTESSPSLPPLFGFLTPFPFALPQFFPFPVRANPTNYLVHPPPKS